MKPTDQKLQTKIFFWAIIVVIVNLIQYLIHNEITIGVSLVITVYALYSITNKKNKTR